MYRACRWLGLALLALSLNVASAADKPDVAPTPKDYPTTHSGDTYCSTPFADSYADRLKAFMNLHAANPGGDPYAETVRMALGFLPDEQGMLRALEKIDARKDCADFTMHGILRLMYRFGDSSLLSEAFRSRARESILGFKYWPDEPGIDSMCSWSENHFILFSSAGYLAGQLFPDEAFVNSGRTGREQMNVFRPRILRWLDLRFRTGFSEWLSNVYYEEDLAPLLDLVDLCKDPEISQRATMVTDLILLDIALNSFRGVFGSTHGRSYEQHKKSGLSDSTRSVAKLLFGLNTFCVGDMGSTGFALSEHYRMPRVIYDIATDLERPEMVNRQRAGIKISEARRWGLDCNRLEDGMTFFTLEAYAHPKIINLTMRMLDEYQWWQNDFFKPFAEQRQMLETGRRWRVLPLVAWWFRRDVQRNLRDEVNIYTYRTPDYMLSTAQDYRNGYGGDQQHIWQATLGAEASCFTTHPVDYKGSSPTYWTGSGSLPRAAQIKNVAIIVYKISIETNPYIEHTLKFTHAWLPRDKFDEVIEKDGWIIARKGDGYLALWSQQPYHWQTGEGPDKDREVIAPGLRNIWICELGRRETDGEFAAFADRIRRAEIKGAGLSVRYQSPSQGALEFGWRGPLKQNGAVIPLKDYRRYDNPYVEAAFPPATIAARNGDHSLNLNWDTCERTASAFVTDEPLARK